MNIAELKTGQGNVEVEGVVTELGNTRVFNKYGRELKVADAILTDDSGSIRLTLWNDDITRFKEGDRVKIINGYVSEFQGDKQLTSGKYGRMEKVSSSAQDKEKVKEDSIKQEIDEELKDKDAVSKKAIVSKRNLKKKNEEKVSSESSDSENLDEFKENIEKMPEEENFRKENEDD